MKYYLLDYENVNASGLDGIGELTSDCRIVLFYTKNSSKIDLGVFNMLRSMKAEMSIIEVHHGKQALDIQLASYLGYLIGTEPADTEYYIISKDKGYRNVQSFWPDRRIVLCRNLSPDSEIVDDPAEEKKPASRSGSRGGRKSSAAKASSTAKASAAAKAPAAEEESKPKAKASKTTRTSSRTKAQPKPVEDVKVEEVKKDAPKAEVAVEQPAVEPAVSEEPKPNAFAEAAAIAKAVVEAKKARNEAAAKKAAQAPEDKPGKPAEKAAEKAEKQADKADKPAKKTRKTASRKKAAEPKKKAEDPKQQEAEAKQKAAEAKHKASDTRNEVNNEIQKRLSKENVDGDIINSTASFVSKNIGKDGFKQIIYRGIIKQHGQKQGLAIYRLIKDIL